MAKYKIVYDITLGEVIDVIEYDSVVSDTKGLEFINKLQEKLDKLREDKGLIDEDQPKDKLIKAYKKVIDYIDNEIDKIYKEMKEHSNNVYTSYNVFVGTPAEAKEFFDGKSVAYEDFKEILKDKKKNKRTK